jgi:hypothetical protein
MEKTLPKGKSQIGCFPTLITGGREMKFRKGAEEKCQIKSPWAL